VDENLDLSWQPLVVDTLQYFAERTPGARVEQTLASIMWHYEDADPDYAAWQSQELQTQINETLVRDMINSSAQRNKLRHVNTTKRAIFPRQVNAPVQVLHKRESKVIEIVPFGITADLLVERTLSHLQEIDAAEAETRGGPCTTSRACCPPGDCADKAWHDAGEAQDVADPAPIKIPRPGFVFSLGGMVAEEDNELFSTLRERTPAAVAAKHEAMEREAAAAELAAAAAAMAGEVLDSAQREVLDPGGCHAHQDPRLICSKTTKPLTALGGTSAAGARSGRGATNEQGDLADAAPD
jgi:hypothetical protein